MNEKALCRTEERNEKELEETIGESIEKFDRKQWTPVGSLDRPTASDSVRGDKAGT